METCQESINNISVNNLIEEDLENESVEVDSPSYRSYLLIIEFSFPLLCQQDLHTSAIMG